MDQALDVHVVPWTKCQNSTRYSVTAKVKAKVEATEFKVRVVTLHALRDLHHDIHHHTLAVARQSDSVCWVTCSRNALVLES